MACSNEDIPESTGVLDWPFTAWPYDFQSDFVTLATVFPEKHGWTDSSALIG